MIARWGWPTLIFTTLFLAASLWLLPPFWPRLIAIPIAAFLWLFVIAFFRNPQRIPQGDESSFVAPADGVIADISEVDDSTVLPGPCLRIGIFLSVFDVHVNRIPIASTVVHSRYQSGAFRDARNSEAGVVNEAQTLVFGLPDSVAEEHRGGQYAVRQIAGLIARRIVCSVAIGQQFKRGDLYGMIRFGSRTELWIPLALSHHCQVTVGQRVRGAETVLCTLASASHQPEDQKANHE